MNYDYIPNRIFKSFTAVLCSASLVFSIGSFKGNNIHFSVADLVAVQKYVLGKDELDNWQRGDLCKDNRVDTFDLCLMRKLVSNSK